MWLLLIGSLIQPARHSVACLASHLISSHLIIITITIIIIIVVVVVIVAVDVGVVVVVVVGVVVGCGWA